jgi:uncharacterized protein (TIGR02145 family)
MKCNSINLFFCSCTLFFLLSASCENENPDIPDSPLNGRTTAVFNPDKKYGSVTDVEGNIYKTIKIGNQVWMAENLRTTRYRNGDPIPMVTDSALWMEQLSAAWCNYNNTENLDTIATYGRLYNWYAVVGEGPQNIAPEGWRVPNADDWNTLTQYLGGDSIAGRKLKEAGGLHWVDPNDADNSSGFTALPGGWRQGFDDFNKRGSYSTLWSTSYNGESGAFLYLFWSTPYVYKGFNYKTQGYNVRCIKE